MTMVDTRHPVRHAADLRPDLVGLAPENLVTRATPERRRPTLRRAVEELPWLVFAGVLPALLASNAEVPGRGILALLLVTLLPGIPVARLLRLPSLLASVVVVTGISIATHLVVAQMLLATGLAGSGPWLLCVGVLSVVLAAIAILRSRPEQVPIRWREPSPRHASHPASPRSILAAVGLLLALAFFAWAVVTTDTSPGSVTGTGLISAMPPPMALALGVLAIVAVSELTRPRLRERWLAAVTMVVAVVLLGYQSLVEQAASLPVAWYHVGFVSYIQTHGEVLKQFDARFSWPGFFAAAANLVQAAHYSDASPFLRFAPLAYNLLMAPPLLLLGRTLLSSRRVAWLGVILYYFGNWYQQDYFSPQATAMVLFISILAVLLWLTSGERGDAEGALGAFSPLRLPAAWRLKAQLVPGIGVGSVAALAGICWALVVAILVSHQLTPVMLIVALVVLRAFGRLRYRNLWFAVAVGFIGWIAYGATDFWAGHLHQILGDVGQVSSTLDSGVAARIKGDPAHLRMQYVRIGMCVMFAGLGFLGLLLRRKSWNHWLLACLAYSPFVMIALQSYGGEVLLRVFLFAMPGLALLAAELLGAMLARGKAATAVLALGLTVLGVWFVGARGANEAFERITPGQVQAARWVSATAPPGTEIDQFNNFTPLNSLWPSGVQGGETRHVVLVRDVISVRYDTNCSPTAAPSACILATHPAWLFLTSSQGAYETQVNGLPADWLQRTITELVSSKNYRLVYSMSDAWVLKRVDRPVRK